MNDEDTVSLNAEQLAKHAMVQAYESPNEYQLGDIPEDLDLSLYDAHNHIVGVDELTTESRLGPSFSDELDDGEVLDGLYVEAEMTGSVSERVSTGSRLNPPEHKQHDVDVFVLAWWFPRPDQLAPLTAIDVHADVDAAMGPPTTPDPHELKYDL